MGDLPKISQVVLMLGLISVYAHIVNPQPNLPNTTNVNWQLEGKTKMSSCYFLSSKMTQVFLFVCLLSFLSSRIRDRLLYVCLSLRCLPLSPVLLSRSSFCLSLSETCHQLKETFQPALWHFLRLSCSHSVSRQLSLCGFGKKAAEGDERRNKQIFK